MAVCPLCGADGYRCGVSEAVGEGGRLHHAVECVEAVGPGAGPDGLPYEDLLLRLGEIDAEDYAAVRSRPGSHLSPVGGGRRPLNPEFHAARRRRLRENPDALRYLSRRGLDAGTLDHFGLGLAEPYVGRGGGREHADALVYPLRGRDGRFYGKYAYYNIPGVTKNPFDPVGWMKGESRTYYSGPAEGVKGLFVCGGAKDLWRHWQGLQGSPLAFELLLVASTHGPALPEEWSDPAFWEPWEAVYFGHGNGEAGEREAARLFELTGRESRRARVPRHLGEDWTDFWQAGCGHEEFARLLEEAPAVSLATPEAAGGAGPGRFAYEPVDIGGAYHGGRLYYTARTLRRGADGGERLETVVVRSDRSLHSAAWAKAPKETRERDRVLRLTDGTLLDREPRENKYATWSWPSIGRYLEGETATRPLARILKDVYDHLRASVWLPDEEDYAVLTLTVPVTYAQRVFDSVPLLFLSGPPGSGKSETGRAMARVCANAYVCGQGSAASVARFIDESRGFVVMDDLELIGGRGGEFSDLAQALKLSYNKATAVKLWTDVKTMRTRSLDFYGVKMINNTRGADEILGSRMLHIRAAKIPDHLKEQFAGLRPSDAGRLQALRDELHTWTFENVPLIEAEYRALCPKGTDRADEISAPLKAMANLAGDAGLHRQLEVALTRRGRRGVDTGDPAGVMKEALKNLILRGHELVAVTHLALEMRALVAHARGGSSAGGAPEWAHPEWVGRALRREGLVESDRPSRLKVKGANLRIYRVSSAHSERVRAFFAGEGVAAQVEPRSPRDFCRACDTCRYRELECPVMKVTKERGTTPVT
ncbi:MAG TPA: hypothetical protein VF736_14380 [Pyrinomonadaceae bacterium]|jgi:hypothetical protein